MKKRIIHYLFMTLSCLLSNQAVAQIVNIEDKRATVNDSIPWKATADANFSWVKNSKDILNLGGKVRLEHYKRQHSFLSLFEINYTIIDDEKFVSSGFEHLRYNRNISQRLIYEAFIQTQFNEQLLLNLRVLLGTGIRYGLNRNVNNPIYVGMSYMYEYDVENHGEVTHLDHRLSNYLSMKIKLSDQVKFYSTTYYQPLLTSFKDYRLSTQNNLVVGISQRLKLNTSFSLIYDSRAPEGAPKLTHALKMGLRFLI